MGDYFVGPELQFCKVVLQMFYVLTNHEESHQNPLVARKDNIQNSFNIQLHSKTGVTMATKSISVSTSFHHCLDQIYAQGRVH